MKKFFRALALVLALALVIGTVPAKTANAGVKKTKVLYVGDAQGKSTDGTKASAIKERVAIYRLAGYKKANKDGHTFKAVATSGAEYVTISKKYVYASALGTAVLEIFVDGESIGNSVVKVKKNADKDTLSITELENGMEVVCGKEYTVTLPRAGKDSDERRLYVDGDLQTEDAEFKRVYKVTFTTAGDHKIKYEAFQSEELDAATAENEITVKAVMPTLVSAKQLTSNSFAAVFSSSVKGLVDPSKIANQDVYYLIADKPVVSGLIKSAVVDDDDPTRVVVTFYSDFKSAETYYFKFGESDPVSFTTAQNGSKYVDSIKISLATTYIGEGNTITVKYFNKDGVEINPTGTEKPTYESSNNAVAYIDTANDKVFFCSEDSVTIKATFFTGDYDPDTFVPVSVEDSITVAGVNKSAATVASTKYSFDGTAANEIHTIRLGGDNGKFAVDYTLSDDTHFKTPGNIDFTSGYWKLQSTDETVAMITGVNGDEVVANKMGQTTIVLYNKDSKGNWGVYDAFALTVDQKNHGATAAVTLSKDTYNLGVGDTAPDLKIVVKDLDGKTYTGKYKVTVAQVDHNAAAVGIDLDTAIDDDTTFTAAANTQTLSFTPNTTLTDKSGRVSFTVKVVDTVSGAVLHNGTHVVSVGDFDGTNTDLSYGYVLKADKTEIDTSIKFYEDKANPYDTATIKLTKVVNTSNGQFFIEDHGWDSIPAKGVIPTTAGSAEQIYLVLSFPSKYDAVAGLVDHSSTGLGAEITITNFTGAQDERAVAGTYTVTAYKATFDTANNQRTGMTTIGSASVLVKKNDAPAKVTIKSSGSQGKAEFLGTYLATPEEVFTVTWDGKSSDDSTPYIFIDALPAIGALDQEDYYTYDNTTESYFVKKITYAVQIETYGPNLTTPIAPIVFTDELVVDTLFKDEK